MMRYILKLYVSGNSIIGQRAIKNIQEIINDLQHIDIDFSIIDLVENPEEINIDSIVATPTLVKSHPEPVIKFIGDLEDKQKIIRALNI